MWPYLTGELGKDGLSSGRSELLLGAHMPEPMKGPTWDSCGHAALIQGDWKIVGKGNVVHHQEGVSQFLLPPSN